MAENQLSSRRRHHLLFFQLFKSTLRSKNATSATARRATKRSHGVPSEFGCQAAAAAAKQKSIAIGIPSSITSHQKGQHMQIAEPPTLSMVRKKNPLG
jgi:hypothetical protein